MEDHDNDTVGVTTTLVALPGLQALAASVRVVLDPGIEEGGDGDGQGQDPDDDDDEQRVLGGNPLPERVHDDDVSVDAHGHEGVSTEKHGHDLQVAHSRTHQLPERPVIQHQVSHKRERDAENGHDDVT